MKINETHTYDAIKIVIKKVYKIQPQRKCKGEGCTQEKNWIHPNLLEWKEWDLWRESREERVSVKERRKGDKHTYALSPNALSCHRIYCLHMGLLIHLYSCQTKDFQNIANYKFTTQTGFLLPTFFMVTIIPLVIVQAEHAIFLPNVKHQCWPCVHHHPQL